MKRLLSTLLLSGIFLATSAAWSAPAKFSSRKSTKKAGPKKAKPKKVSAKILAAADTSYPAHLTKAVASKDRPEADRKRDKYRKPTQVLNHIGIKPGMRVADMMAGRGYYTELLSRAVGSKGKVWSHNNRFVNKRFADKAMKKRLAGNRLPNVVRLNTELETPNLPKNLDIVVMALFYHDTFWMKTNRKKMNQAILTALKPGGLFVVIDHHAEKGAGGSKAKKLHRVEAELVRLEVIRAGFLLDGSTDMLRNPNDDRTINVFKPSIRGKTDRFIFVFRRPKEVVSRARDTGKTTEVVKLSTKVIPAKKKAAPKKKTAPAKKVAPKKASKPPARRAADDDEDEDEDEGEDSKDEDNEEDDN